MLALRVEYLTGVCMATRHNDAERAKPEWPPHPDRLYSALVAAADPDQSGASGCSGSTTQALKWLLEQGAPQLHATQAYRRTTPAVPMPSNPHEAEVWARAEKNNPGSSNLLPVHRKKTLLPIPAVVPDEPVVYFIWPSADPDGYREILRSICDSVTCLGRSRSLVRVTVEDRAPVATHVPDLSGEIQLRVPREGRLSYLIDKHRRDGGKPAPSPLRRYRHVDAPSIRSEGQRSIFTRSWVFRPAPDDPVLPIEATVNVTRALRRVVLREIHEVTCGCRRWEGRLPPCRDASDCYATIPSVLSGYAGDCRPIRAPHVAFISLPFVHVTQRHADGNIKGVAVLIPQDLDDDTAALTILAQALTRIEANGMVIPRIGTWHLKEEPADAPSLLTLDHRTWTGPSRTWTTATPMVFGHFPKPRNGGETKVVLDSLRLAGIDASNVVEIAVGRHAWLHGAPPSWYFRARREQARAAELRPWIRHVTLRFERPVLGPLAIGAQRYFGLGLMKPVEPNRG